MKSNTKLTPAGSTPASTNSNELVIISQQEVLNKNFTVYGTYENPLFLAKDVAEWIEHSNVTEMVRYVDSDEKLNSKILNAGQYRDQLFLTEDGLYEVLMQSRKPIAKSFKKEVKKILKELRVKGHLPSPPPSLPHPNHKHCVDWQELVIRCNGIEIRSKGHLPFSYDLPVSCKDPVMSKLIPATFKNPYHNVLTDLPVFVELLQSLFGLPSDEAISLVMFFEKTKHYY